MKIRVKKAIVIMGTACMLAQTVTGCGQAPAEAAETSEAGTRADETDAVQPGIADEESNAADTEPDTTGAEPNEAGLSGEQQENSEGRWHVLAPDVAAAIDADFAGVVWKIDTDSFYIVESQIEIFEDGSLSGSSPSTDAKIPDSELIQVVFDADTYFYIRAIYDGGARHEDNEAGFADLEKGMSVEMKGEFINDVFHADEIRLIKVS